MYGIGPRSDLAAVHSVLVLAFDGAAGPSKGGGALCAGNAVALLVFGPVMP